MRLSIIKMKLKSDVVMFCHLCTENALTKAYFLGI